MIAIDDFTPLMAGEVLGAPDTAIEEAVIRTAIRFCKDTHVWKSPRASQDIRSGQNEYYLPVPQKTRIEKVGAVYVDGKLMLGMPLDEMPVTAATGTPNSVYISDNDRLFLYPTPNSDIPGGLVVDLVLIPDYSAKRLPDFLYHRYRDAIVHGALAFLLSMPGKPWTGTQVDVMRNERFYRHQVIVAKSNAVDGRMSGSMTVRKRSFV